MISRIVILSVMANLALALGLAAQPLTRTYASTEQMLEGGRVDILVMDTGKDSYAVTVPKGFAAQVRLDTSSITFTSPSNISLITMQWSTNYAGALPKIDELQGVVAAKWPGASILQPFPCVTGCGPGKGFDLVRVVAPGMTLRMRDGFVALPGGSVEFTFSCNGPDFDHENRAFMRLLNSFRLRAEDVKNSL